MSPRARRQTCRCAESAETRRAWRTCVITCVITGTPTTVPTNCAGGTSTVCDSVRIRGTCRCITSGMSTALSRRRHIDDRRTLHDALLGRGPRTLQQRHLDDQRALRDVLLDLGQGHAINLRDDLFQSCDSLHQRNVRGLILPCQRRRRCLIVRMEEETAPTSVGTGRPPPAWRHQKMCIWLSRMGFHLGSSHRGLHTAT